MSEVRNGERPTYAVSSPDAEPADLVSLRWTPGHHVSENDGLLAIDRRDATAVDDELVTGLERTVSQTIRSAQEVAHQLIARAQEREALVRAKTDERCRVLVTQAEREATAILHRAAAEAVGRLKDAESGISEMLADAHRRRDLVLGELERQSLALKERIARLRDEHDRLAQALDVVDETVREGRYALDAELDRGAGRPSSGRAGQDPGNGSAPPTGPAYAAGGTSTRGRSQ